jgi:hypothetical protein
LDLNSDGASSAALEFIYALDDLTQELGYRVLKPAD